MASYLKWSTKLPAPNT